MRAIISGLVLVFALSWIGSAEAAKGKKKAAVKKEKIPAVATKQTTMAIEKLLGAYKWGLNSAAVMNQLEKDIRTQMEPVIKGTQDPMAQDRVRRDMMDKIKTLKGSQVKFEGKPTPWDVSLVDKEFAHKNGETLIPVWTKDERRFYFFHNDRLWKMFIAFNAEKFEGKTFEDFAQVMENRFGRAERKYTATLKGDAKMSHLSWPPSATTILRAIDNTGFYGNFCLVLSDRNELQSVRAGRKANSPKKEYSDPLVDSVTAKKGTVDTMEPPASEDGVPPADDTGKKGKGKGKGKGKKGGVEKVDTSDDSSTTTGKKKKINEKNPLDGLDI
jgi:hypothetical protein